MMPNWCKGELKVRGTKDNLKKFILEGLNPTGWSVLNKIPDSNVDEDEDGFTRKIICENDGFGAFHLAGTRRQFIESKEIEIYWREDQEIQVLVLSDFEAAWDIDTEGLQQLSKKFEVDFKIYAFECGMEFNRDIEIVDGEITKDDEIKFNDYEWECICPSVGG